MFCTVLKKTENNLTADSSSAFCFIKFDVQFENFTSTTVN